MLACDFSQAVRRGAGNGFCEGEEGVILALAEVLGAEEFRQADEGGAGLCRLRDALACLVEVFVDVRFAAHLDECDACRAHSCMLLSATVILRCGYCMMSRMSAASWSTRAKSLSHANMKRAPPPMNV